VVFRVKLRENLQTVMRVNVGVIGEYLPLLIIFLAKSVINICVRQGNQTNLVSRGIGDENNIL
jgi:hypothetical protein